MTSSHPLEGLSISSDFLDYSCSFLSTVDNFSTAGSVSIQSRFIRLFFSPKERRLRAGWRILGQLLLLLILAIAFRLTIYPRLNLENLPDDIKLLSQSTIQALIVTPSSKSQYQLDFNVRYFSRRLFLSLRLGTHSPVVDFTGITRRMELFRGDSIWVSHQWYRKLPLN